MKRWKEWVGTRKKALVCGGILLTAAVILCCLLSPYVVGLLSKAEWIRVWVQQHRMAGRMAYIGIVILQVILAVIPGEPVEILGGYVFGAVEGTLLCLLAAAVGSVTVFCLVRRFGVKLVKAFFSNEKVQALHFLQSSPKRIFLFLIIYMIPGTPKDLLSYYAGLTDIKLPVFLMICSLGRIPSLVTSTIGGDALGMKSYLFAIAVFAVTLLVSAAGMMIYNRICRQHEERRRVK